MTRLSVDHCHWTPILLLFRNMNARARARAARLSQLSESLNIDSEIPFSLKRRRNTKYYILKNILYDPGLQVCLEQVGQVCLEQVRDGIDVVVDLLEQARPIVVSSNWPISSSPLSTGPLVAGRALLLLGSPGSSRRLLVLGLMARSGSGCLSRSAICMPAGRSRPCRCPPDAAIA